MAVYEHTHTYTPNEPSRKEDTIIERWTHMNRKTICVLWVALRAFRPVAIRIKPRTHKYNTNALTHIYTKCEYLSMLPVFRTNELMCRVACLLYAISGNIKSNSSVALFLSCCLRLYVATMRCTSHQHISAKCDLIVRTIQQGSNA